MKMNFLLAFLLLIVVFVSTVPAPKFSDQLTVTGTCLEPLADAPATYAVITGFPTLLLTPADGWTCRCLLLEEPVCTCVLVPVAEDDTETPIYFDAATRNHRPEFMLGF
jgi:hypothetical protein